MKPSLFLFDLIFYRLAQHVFFFYNLAKYFTFMTTLIVILLVLYIVLRVSGKYLFPYLLKRYINNVKRNLESQHQQYQESDTYHEKSMKDSDPGNAPEDSIEYTDFEEIKDDQKQ